MFLRGFILLNNVLFICKYFDKLIEIVKKNYGDILVYVKYEGG